MYIAGCCSCHSSSAASKHTLQGDFLPKTTACMHFLKDILLMLCFQCPCICMCVYGILHAQCINRYSDTLVAGEKSVEDNSLEEDSSSGEDNSSGEDSSSGDDSCSKKMSHCCCSAYNHTIYKRDTESARVQRFGAPYYPYRRWHNKKKLMVFFERDSANPPQIDSPTMILSLANLWHVEAKKEGVIVPEFESTLNKDNSDIRTWLTGYVRGVMNLGGSERVPYWQSGNCHLCLRVWSSLHIP